jgi:hypothetical protein
MIVYKKTPKNTRNSWPALWNWVSSKNQQSNKLTPYLILLCKTNRIRTTVSMKVTVFQFSTSPMGNNITERFKLIQTTLWKHYRNVILPSWEALLVLNFIVKRVPLIQRKIKLCGFKGRKCGIRNTKIKEKNLKCWIYLLYSIK